MDKGRREPGPEPGPSLLPSSVTTRLGIALAAWTLLLPITWLLTRRPKRGGWFLGLIITAAIGFPMFSYGSLGVANALFDGGTPKERPAQVLGRKKLTGQNNSHPYRLIVRSWLPDTQEHEIIVESELWHTKPKQVIVLEKPGLLGWPWVDEVRAVPSK